VNSLVRGYPSRDPCQSDLLSEGVGHGEAHVPSAVWRSATLAARTGIMLALPTNLFAKTSRRMPTRVLVRSATASPADSSRPRAAAPPEPHVTLDTGRPCASMRRELGNRRRSSSSAIRLSPPLIRACGFPALGSSSGCPKAGQQGSERVSGRHGVARDGAGDAAGGAGISPLLANIFLHHVPPGACIRRHSARASLPRAVG
jgi:hypothetical protein